MQLPFTSAGTNILWLDPSEKFVNFSSNTATVASIFDRHNGEVYIPQSTNPPTWHSSLLGKYVNEGNGQPGFTFDGTQSIKMNLPTGFVLNGIGKQIIYVGACHPTTFTPSITHFNAVFDFGGKTSSTAGFFDFEFFDFGGNKDCDIERGDDASNFDAIGPFTTDAKLHVYTVIYDGTNAILRVDGVQKLNSPATTTNAGNLTINQISIGDWTDGSFPASTHAYYIGHMGHQTFFYGDPTTTPTEVEDYMMELYGL